EKTADSEINSQSNSVAIKLASVVFPTPGGPQKIIEGGSPDAIASKSGFPGERRCSCPTTSAKVFGRAKSASGVTLSVVSSINASNKSAINPSHRSHPHFSGAQIQITLDQRGDSLLLY